MTPVPRRQMVLRPTLGAVLYVGGRLTILLTVGLLLVLVVVALLSVCLLYLSQAIY